MRFKRSFPLPLALLILQTGTIHASVAATPDRPETFPACTYPQPITGLQEAGGGHVGGRTAIVWNGKDYATIYADATDNALHFRRFYADGTPVAPAVTVSGLSAAPGESPALLWNGSGYAVAWVSNGSPRQIFFALLNGAGGVTSGPALASVGAANDALQPTLAMGGGRYLVAFSYFFGGSDWDLQASLFDSAGAPFYSNFPISNSSLYSEGVPSATWNSTAGVFQLIWREYSISGPASYKLSTAQIPPAGSVTVNSGIISSGVNFFDTPHLISAGGMMAVVYLFFDSRQRAYFSRMGPSGLLWGTPFEVSNTPNYVYDPRLVWTGGEYAAFWSIGSGDIWMQRVSSGGAPLGSNVQATSAGYLSYPDAAFGKSGFLVTGSPSYAPTPPYGPNHLQGLGCAYETTPPSCPGNFLAYNITGTSATVAWSPASDNESDLAYYQVYRNNAPLAKTADPFFNDSGLPLSSTNNYMIQPVNAAQLQNTGCTASLYLKTNASLTLTMSKANPDAVLNWTDAGFNNYNVFRGLDPRVMQQIGATPALTAQDANALNDSLSYFYTVDDPGP